MYSKNKRFFFILQKKVFQRRIFLLFLKNHRQTRLKTRAHERYCKNIRFFDSTIVS